MRILLIGNYRPAAQYSMQRFARLLAEQLTEAGHDVRLLRPPALLGALRPGASGVGKWLGYVDRFLLFLPLLRRAARAVDLVHICDQANAPYARWLGAVPRVVTCHDLLAARCALGEFPDQRVRWSGRQYQRAILRGLGRATRVVFVSEHSRGHGLRLTGLPASRGRVVANAAAPVFRPVPVAARASVLQDLGIDPAWRFLLHVGGNQWYKNRPAVLEIFERLLALPGYGDLRLVMAGKPWCGILRAQVRRSGVAARIRECADLDDARLAALYSAATALVFPSREEGFGWPLIEAQACGCPVFASARAPLTEVAGDGARYFDIGDIDGAAAVIAVGLARREQLVAAGFNNVGRFAPAVMRDGYLRAYADALACGHRDGWES